MKIAIWNLMRPNARTVDRNRLFINTINKIDLDIIILTETNSIIEFGDKYFSASTKSLPVKYEDFSYEAGQNRATILSKFLFKK